MEAHILVRFFTLALWRSLEQWMDSKDMGTCARRLVSALSTIKSMDVLLPVERNQERHTLRLRVVAKPEKEVAQLLAHHGLRQSKMLKM